MISGPTSDGLQTASGTSSAAASSPWKSQKPTAVFRCTHTPPHRKGLPPQLEVGPVWGLSPLLLLGALGQRLHVELGQVPAVLVPPQVPLLKQVHQKGDRSEGFRLGDLSVLVDLLPEQTSCGSSGRPSSASWLCPPTGSSSRPPRESRRTGCRHRTEMNIYLETK